MNTAAGSSPTVVNLGYHGRYDSASLLRAIEAHAVPAVETCDVDGRNHAKVVTTPSGPVLVEVDHEAVSSGAGVVAQLSLADPAHAAAAVGVIRRWLDLDAEPHEVDAALARDHIVGPLAARRPGLRVLGSTNGFETAVMTVIGQQVSLAAARTFGARLVAAFGEPVVDGYRTFPRAETLAAVDPALLRSVVGLTGARADTVCRLATLVSAGFDIDEPLHRAELRDALLAVPGIGQWTVDYVWLRVSGDRDAFVAGDLVLRRALGVRTAREAATIAESWRPWRAYALMHLWTQAAYG